MLLRNRKGLFSSTITIIAYAALALVIAQFSARALISKASGIALPPLLPESGNSALVWFLGFNALRLVWRLG